MPKKTLERLTFEYLKAFDRADCARQAYEIMPIRQNHLAWVEAEGRFEESHDALRTALFPATVHNYIQGLRGIADASIAHTSPKKPASKCRHRVSGQKAYLADPPEGQEE